MKNDKLKIAVQLYGHLRTFEACALMLRDNLLQQYDCDVFVHTWDSLEHSTPTWHNSGLAVKDLTVSSTVIDKINHYYQPKSLLIEKQNFIHEEGVFGTHSKIKISLQGMKYMLYGQYMVNKLRLDYQKEKQIDYDFVIVLRPDIQLLEPVDFSNYKNEFDFYDRASIHLVHSQQLSVIENKIFHIPLTMDCLFFARPDTITEIADCYCHFDRFYKDYSLVFPEGVGTPELALFEYLLEQGIAARQYLFNYTIKRHNDNDDIRPSYSSPQILWREINNEMPYKISSKQKVKNAIKLSIFKIVNVMPDFLKKPIIIILKGLAGIYAIVNSEKY